MPRWIDAIWPKRSFRTNLVMAGQTNAVWQQVLSHYPFLSRLDAPSQIRLQDLSLRFLKQKEFHGAHGLQITDSMAMSIAAQACLPLLNMGAPQQALAWYEDFVGIVVHPAEMRARRKIVDEAGVVHHYQEELAGEAMEGGPVTLNWKDVANADEGAVNGMNLVIHEFAHKMDMRYGQADGCPPLPNAFMGTQSDRQAHRLWLSTLQGAYDTFREQCIQAERFGQTRPWLDAYAAHSLPEFFAVACEAYFVNPERFETEFPALMPIFDNFFDRRQRR